MKVTAQLAAGNSIGGVDLKGTGFSPYIYLLELCGLQALREVEIREGNRAEAQP